MPSPTGAEIQALLDRAHIRDVILRYARGIDRRDWDLVAACFVPGAIADYLFVPAAPIEAVIPAIRDALARFATTMHTMGNQLIELNGDRADSETYAVCYHRIEAAEPQLFTVGMKYLDTLARRSDGWRISQRRITFEWQSTVPMAPPPTSRRA